MAFWIMVVGATLAAAAPQDGSRQQDLAVAHERVGEVQRAYNALPEALAAEAKSALENKPQERAAA